MGYLSEVSIIQRSGAHSLSPPAPIFYWLRVTPKDSIFPTLSGCSCIWTKPAPTASENSLEAERSMCSFEVGCCQHDPELPWNYSLQLCLKLDQGMFFEVPKMLDIISLMSFWRGILSPHGSCALKFPLFLWHLLHTFFNCRHSYMCIISLLDYKLLEDSGHIR